MGHRACREATIAMGDGGDSSPVICRNLPCSPFRGAEFDSMCCSAAGAVGPEPESLAMTPWYSSPRHRMRWRAIIWLTAEKNEIVTGKGKKNNNSGVSLPWVGGGVFALGRLSLDIGCHTRHDGNRERGAGR